MMIKNIWKKLFGTDEPTNEVPAIEPSPTQIELKSIWLVEDGVFGKCYDVRTDGQGRKYILKYPKLGEVLFLLPNGVVEGFSKSHFSWRPY